MRENARQIAQSSPPEVGRGTRQCYGIFEPVAIDISNIVKQRQSRSGEAVPLSGGDHVSGQP